MTRSELQDTFECCSLLLTRSFSIIKSKDAYMLVYVRRDATSTTNPPEPPAPAKAHLNLQEEELQKEVAEYRVKCVCVSVSKIKAHRAVFTRRAEVEASFEQTKGHKREIYESWWSLSDDRVRRLPRTAIIADINLRDHNRAMLTSSQRLIYTD